jgi:16S rRNA (adenine1518-N6/adenine1519-N6)-dimethyltransferase
LRRLGLKATKGLGQHFLIDRDVLGRILSAAEIQPHDMVVEVGPGLGILTAELATRAQKVVAVEVDPNLAVALQRQLSDALEVTVLHADILQLDPAELVPAEKTAGNPQAYKVVANLPYYLASPIIRHFLEASARPTILVVMLQKEVAESVVAGPGHMSLVGIGVQLYGRPEIVDYVPARSFHPRPKVDSAIVRIDVYDSPAIDPEDVGGFFDVVRAGFSAPRKQIRNEWARLHGALAGRR